MLNLKVSIIFRSKKFYRIFQYLIKMLYRICPADTFTNPTQIISLTKKQRFKKLFLLTKMYYVTEYRLFNNILLIQLYEYFQQLKYNNELT